MVSCASYIAIYLVMISFRVEEGSRTFTLDAVVALSLTILTLSQVAFHVFDLQVSGGSTRAGTVRNRSLSFFRSLRIRTLRETAVAPRRSGGVSNSNADTAVKLLLGSLLRQIKTTILVVTGSEASGH